jgi:hypothetical protein
LRWFLIESTAGLFNDDDVLYFMLLASIIFLRIINFDRERILTLKVLSNFGENIGDVAFAVQSYICPPVVLEGVRQPLVERDPAVLVLVNLLEELGTDRLSSPSQLL